MRVIAFTGPKTCGKDTAAKCLFKHNIGDRRQYFRKAPFAQGIKNEGADYFGWTEEQMDDPVFKETPIELWPGGPVIEPRWFLMDGANWKRDRYGEAIHAWRWWRNCQAQANWWGAHVVTDLRFPDEEIPAIRRAEESLIIYIARKEAESALQEARDAGDPKALNVSEIHYARLYGRADIIIPNDGTIAQLHNAVNTAVHVKFGHWIHWMVPFIGGAMS